MKTVISDFFKRNYIPIAFVLIAVINELTAVFVTGGAFYMRSPWMYFGILAIIAGVQFLIPNNIARYVYSLVFLLGFFFCQFIFIWVYRLTGTVFDFSMFQITGEGVGMIEEVPIDPLHTAVSVVLIAAFAALVPVFRKKTPKPASAKLTKIILPCVMAVIVACQAIFGYVSETGKRREGDLTNRLYSSMDGSYIDEGMMGNFFSELYRGMFKSVRADSDGISDFVYGKTSEPTERFGTAAGYNVVTVLCESFEWFGFLKDAEAFPNGHKADEHTLRKLYPNLYEFYDRAVVMTEFHSREKTDISENLSLIGNYPTDVLVNYDYPTNNIAYSLPNIMSNVYGVKSESFHNGTNSFYNRNNYLTDAVGFDSFVSVEQMTGDTLTDYTLTGERNLDSEMLETCKTRMFPTDRRFNTYITTLTTHGNYDYRKNLEPYYKILDEYGVAPADESSPTSKANIFRNYAAAAMDFDKALGIMTDYLAENGLTDNTVIAMFGDHNAFLQNLSGYVKDNDGENGKNPTDLFRVMFMLKIGAGESGTKFIDKFTCTADILPTLTDLLGIKSFSNLYYGNSVFSDKESILFSRAYDVFMTDKMYFTNLKHIKYVAPSVTDDYRKDIENRALELLKKASYVNRIFSTDFFTGEEGERFYFEMKKLNGLTN